MVPGNVAVSATTSANGVRFGADSAGRRTGWQRIRTPRSPELGQRPWRRPLLSDVEGMDGEVGRFLDHAQGMRATPSARGGWGIGTPFQSASRVWKLCGIEEDREAGWEPEK